MAALKAESGGCLGHVPAMLLELAQNKFALVGAACFVQGRVRMVRAFSDAAEKFRRKVMWLNASLRTDDDQPFDKITQLANISRPGVAQKNFHRGITELARPLAVGRAEFT